MAFPIESICKREDAIRLRRSNRIRRSEDSLFHQFSIFACRNARSFAANRQSA
jgi:hypothetical protein